MNMNATMAADGVDTTSASSALVLQTFHKDFGEHRTELTTLVVDGEPWFKGPEAAAALGYAAPAKAVRTHVDDEDRQRLDTLRGIVSVPLTNANEGACSYISESGLYSLIMSSKLAHAKAFKRWVMKEVLPSIRRTGIYSVQASLQENDEKDAEQDDEKDDESTSMEVALPSSSTETTQWETRRAKLDALASAHSLACAAGVPLREAHNRAISSAVHDALLSADPLRIDAAEFLCRKGHSHTEIRRLAPELGKALRTAWIHRRGDDKTPFDTGIAQYRVREDALFLETVYAHFRLRPVFARVCGALQEASGSMTNDVTAALANARGFATAQRNGVRSSSAIVPGG
jgi:prophage antirepressor-like protein